MRENRAKKTRSCFSRVIPGRSNPNQTSYTENTENHRVWGGPSGYSNDFKHKNILFSATDCTDNTDCTDESFGSVGFIRVIRVIRKTIPQNRAHTCTILLCNKCISKRRCLVLVPSEATCLPFGILLFGIYLGFGILGFGILRSAPHASPSVAAVPRCVIRGPKEEILSRESAWSLDSLPSLCGSPCPLCNWFGKNKPFQTWRSWK